MSVTLARHQTIIFLQGKEGRARFDAMEVQETDGGWKPLLRPNFYDSQKGFTEYRYLKKIINIGGFPVSFEVRESR